MNLFASFVDGAVISPTTDLVAGLVLLILLPVNYYLRWVCWYNGGRQSGQPSPDEEWDAMAKSRADRMK